MQNKKFQPPYQLSDFQKRLVYKQEDFFSLMITLYRLIEFTIIAHTDGLIALCEETLIPEGETSILARVFREVSFLSEQSLVDQILYESMESQLNNGRELVETCLVFESQKSLQSENVPFFAFSEAFDFIFQDQIQEIRNFAFFLFDALSAKHDFSKEVFLRNRLIMQGSPENELESLTKIISLQREENKFKREEFRLPKAAPNHMEIEMIYSRFLKEQERLYESFGDALTQKEIDSLL